MHKVVNLSAINRRCTQVTIRSTALRYSDAFSIIDLRNRI